MAAPQSKALVRRSTDTELMPPPPKRIKRPQKVLDEESYTDGLSHIIARDFFPGLLEAETKQEYLDALESRDGEWIATAGRKLTEVMTPGRRVGRRGTSLQASLGSDTPIGYSGATPMTVASDATSTAPAATAKVEVDTNMSLDSFQSKYTSEDNESFYKLLDKQNQTKAEKYAWMWNGNKISSKRLLKQKEVETKLLESRGSLVDDGGDRDRLAIKDVDHRPAMPDSWKAKPNNEFMFKPDGVEDSVETIAQKAQADSRAAPKSVVYGNTRLPEAPVSNESSVPPSPSLSAIQDAIAGRPRRTDSESGFDGSETPRVNGYAFVDDEPEPEEEKPAAPLIDLGKGDATPNPFKILEQSKREDLHHRMVAKAAKNKRESNKLGMTGKVDQTPVPKFPSSPRVGVGSLTPAAQRLWSKVGGSRSSTTSGFETRTPRTVKSRESRLKIGWTPKGP